MLKCRPTKNLSTINRSWEDFPDRKFDSNFIHAAENTAFLFCLSGSLEQSLASVENLRQNPAMRSLKFAFCPSLSRCSVVKRSLSENSFTRGLPKTCGRISASTWAASWVENIQEDSSSISSLFKLKFCCFSLAFPVDRGSFFFLFWTWRTRNRACITFIFIRTFFWTATWWGTFKIFTRIYTRRTKTIRGFLTSLRHFDFFLASGEMMTSVKIRSVLVIGHWVLKFAVNSN